MSESLDARGLSCPAPVLLAKDAVEEGGLTEIEVLVDNEAAKENVSRFLGSQQFAVTSMRMGSDFKICGQRQGGSVSAAVSKPDRAPAARPDGEEKILVLVSTDRLGFGDDHLGKKLMVSFITTLKEMGDSLWRLVFVNNGVKLTVDDSPVLADLVDYEKKGLTLLVCGTCLTHFGLLEAKKVGDTTNMLDIVTAMQLADKVISI